MSRVKYLFLYLGFVLICKQVTAKNSPRNQQRYDAALETYVYEPYDDYQSDGTTAYPPLIEDDSNPKVLPAGIVDVETTDAPLIPPPPPPHEEIPSKVPEGPVQKYYNSQNYYGPPVYTQSSSYPNNYYPVYPWQNIYQPQYPSQPSAPSMPTNYLPMQPEYEGILVPVQTLAPPAHTTQTQTRMPTQTMSIQQTNPTSSKIPESKITPMTNHNSFDLALILQALLPPSVISFIIMIGNFVLNSFSTIAFAGAITSVLCSLTPICTISFGSLPFAFRQMIISGGEVSTIQRVRRAAEVVSDALEKYERIQKGVESLTKSLKKSQRRA